MGELEVDATQAEAVAKLIEKKMMSQEPALAYQLELLWRSLKDPDGCRYSHVSNARPSYHVARWSGGRGSRRPAGDVVRQQFEPGCVP